MLTESTNCFMFLGTSFELRSLRLSISSNSCLALLSIDPLVKSSPVCYFSGERKVRLSYKSLGSFFLDLSKSSQSTGTKLVSAFNEPDGSIGSCCSNLACSGIYLYSDYLTNGLSGALLKSTRTGSFVFDVLLYCETGRELNNIFS
jgi:hypothetical protein